MQAGIPTDRFYVPCWNTQNASHTLPSRTTTAAYTHIVHGLPAKQSWTSLLLCHWRDVLADIGMMDLLQNASTALHCAAWEAHPVTVELLLQKQADIQVCTAGLYVHCWCPIFTWCLAANKG